MFEDIFLSYVLIIIYKVLITGIIRWINVDNIYFSFMCLVLCQDLAQVKMRNLSSS